MPVAGLGRPAQLLLLSVHLRVGGRHIGGGNADLVEHAARVESLPVAAATVHRNLEGNARPAACKSTICDGKLSCRRQIAEPGATGLVAEHHLCARQPAVERFIEAA